ncbi:ABC transporter ATP-binding protein [Oceanibaculum pacificum]|uniref:Peptide ABC transporter ATP-binding protein n=1 Tax=Oceanibaculum pacificum TaxID=580166 RepID=A0A154W1Z5_9PROT|nr:dipeptide ABC transporter ATP-binding protein [Oceanibaculum pacificum]KZD07662.1 peptide ABC transporter ATP-binding protein [Oceanibaculum pacificum]
MSAILDIAGLKIGVPEGPLVVDDVSLSVQAGEVVAVVGESGSGKTMVARSILGLLPPGLVRGEGAIRFKGESIEAAPWKRMRALRGGEIGMVFQEPMVSLNPAIRIGRQMEEGLAIHRPKMGREERRCLCADMLRRVGIEDAERCLMAFPHEFSGGMRQRVMIAMALACRPKLLIADEPTTALDSLTQREVLDLMVGLTREMGTAVLLITHDLGVVARYSQRCVVLEKGKLVEAGATAQIIGNPQHPYTQRLIDAIPRPEPHGGDQATGAPILAVENIAVSFTRRGGLFGRSSQMQALKGVSLEVRPGETVAVVGGSGSGKTTLGRTILQLVKPSGGGIAFRGEPLLTADRAALHRFRMNCQLISQDPYSSLDPRMRVGAIVEEALRLLPALSPAEKQARVTDALAEVGLSGYERRFPHQLSGGQRQRVAIARALIREPALVIADEPISALDMTIQKQILDLLGQLQRQRGFSCLFISHDLAAVRQIASRVIVMQEGLIVEQGETEAVFGRPRHPYTRALMEASPALALSSRTLDFAEASTR